MAKHCLNTFHTLRCLILTLTLWVRIVIIVILQMRKQAERSGSLSDIMLLVGARAGFKPRVIALYLFVLLFK